MKKIVLLLMAVYSTSGYCGLFARMQENRNNYIINNYDKIKSKQELKEGELSDFISIKKDISYSVYSTDNTLDIYYNRNSTTVKKPVIFMIHGGAWLVGDKSSGGVVKNKAEFFVGKKDYIFISVNYRMEKNKVHPQEVLDVADALSWVYKNIEQFGGDKNKLIVMGHSAGAHLASLVVTDKKYLNNKNVPLTAVKGVVPLDGGGFDLNYLLNKNSSLLSDLGGGIKNKLILEKVQNIYDLAWKDYSLEELRDASPIVHVDRRLPPFFLLESTRNPSHIILGDNFAKVIKQYGTIVKRKDYDLKHEEINSLLGLDNELTKDVEQFVEDVLK